MFKKLTYFLLSGTLTVTALFTGCSDNAEREDDKGASPQNIGTVLNAVSERSERSESENQCTVNIDGEIDITGEGAWFEGNTLTISEGGEYRLSGNIIDGCLYMKLDL